ncbi:MAG: hypothetical protein ACK5GV_12070 [Bacteroidota bacterium]|jgi:hypothetical protein
MTVKDYKGGKIITLSKAFDTRAKLLNITYFLVFTVGACVFGVIGSSIVTSDIWFGMLAILVFTAYGIAGYKFINKSFQSEKIIIDKTSLTIIKRGIFFAKKDTYENAYISNFTHLDKPKITKHALAGQTFDYLGFQTEQAVINEMHGDNRLSFDYKGKRITFGENIYTWDFEELEILLYDITGNDFRYTDDFEKTFTSED